MLTTKDVFDTMVSEGEVALYKLDEWAQRTPHKTFIFFGEADLSLSYAETKRMTDRLAAGFAGLGVGRGDRVSVLTRNSLAAALAMFAAWRCGALYAPHNFNLKGKLLSYQINDTGPKLLVTDTSFAEQLDTIANEITVDHVVVLPEQYGATQPGDEVLNARFRTSIVHPFSQLISSDDPVPSVELGPFDPATIIYTSGTTGPAKGVLLSNRWINQYVFGGRSQLGHDDVIYCDLPLYHVGGVYALLGRALWKGCTVGLWNRFSPSAFWDRIAACGATACILLDIMVPWLMAAPPRSTDRHNTLNKVHMQPLPANHHEVALRFGFDFTTCGFGQTESGSGFSAIIDHFGEEYGTPQELYHGLSKEEYRAVADHFGRVLVNGRDPLPIGFMGRPSPLLETAILDESDNVLPAGSVGQLAFRPRFPGLLMQEYWNKPDATLRAFRNLWFHTGDAVRNNADGTYSFVDRMGGYFRVRGENVSSYEVESVLNAHPKVGSTAAVPIPAQEGSEDDIAVFVQLKENEQLSEEELRIYSSKEMPRYMQPAYVRFVDALPVTPTSKIEKYKLKQMIMAELQDVSSPSG